MSHFVGVHKVGFQ